MPRWWYDRHAIADDVPEDQQRLCRAIVADRKPYFMRYIYPALSKQYNSYVKAANTNAMRLFDMSIPEMSEMPVSSLTDDQLNFIQQYKRHMPVGTGNCVMNTICRKIESIFGEYITQKKQEKLFDYEILKSGSDYSIPHFSAIKSLWEEYDRRLREHSADAKNERISDDERKATLMMLDDYFSQECARVCPDADELCDIVLDLCYGKEKTKQFAWHMCGDKIVSNLYKKRGKISFPARDDEGEIVWKAKRFTTKTIQMDVIE